VLTAHLNVQSPEPSTHRPGAEYSILEQEAKRLIETVPPAEQEVFRQHLLAKEFLCSCDLTSVRAA
jgi:hypothetical protein